MLNFIIIIAFFLHWRFEFMNTILIINGFLSVELQVGDRAMPLNAPLIKFSLLWFPNQSNLV